MVDCTKCCRLCLKDDEFLQKFKFKDISELYRKIYLHFDVLVSESEALQLPTKICQECASKVYDFDVFYNDVQHNQEQLKLCIGIQNNIPELKREDDDCLIIKVETDHIAFVLNSENRISVDSNESIISTRKRSGDDTPTKSKKYDKKRRISPLGSLNNISTNNNTIAATQNTLYTTIDTTSITNEVVKPNNILNPTNHITENDFKIINVKSLNNSEIPSFLNEMANSITNDKETSLYDLPISSSTIKIKKKLHQKLINKIRLFELSDKNKKLLKRYKCKNSYVKLKRLSTLENKLNQINLLNVSGMTDKNNTVLKNIMNKNLNEQLENNSEKNQKKVVNSTETTEKIMQPKMNTIKQPIINSLLQLPQNMSMTETIIKTPIKNTGKAPVELYTGVNNKVSETSSGMIPTVNSTSTNRIDTNSNKNIVITKKYESINTKQKMQPNSQPEKQLPYLFYNSTGRFKILTVPELNQKVSNNQLLYNKLSITPSTTSFSQITSYSSIQAISQHQQISKNNLSNPTIDTTLPIVHAENSIKPHINVNISVPSENKNELIKLNNLTTAKTVQNIKCCVENCNAKQIEFPNLVFYRFPRNEVLRNIWMENCKIISLKGITSHFVCGKHFKKTCLGGGKLRHYAIPTVFVHPIKNLNCFLVKKNSKPYIKKCSVNECNGTNESKKMFRFPPQKNIGDQWVTAIGFQMPYNIENKFVCEKHFPKSLIQKQKLKKNSIPSLYLS